MSAKYSLKRLTSRVRRYSCTKKRNGSADRRRHATPLKAIAATGRIVPVWRCQDQPEGEQGVDRKRERERERERERNIEREK